MASTPWDCFAPYEVDVQAALKKLAVREFQGDYEDVNPLSDEELVRCFGTTRPTREMVEDNLANAAEEDEDLYQNIGRGQGFYVVTYKNENPSEIFFGGYAYD